MSYPCITCRYWRCNLLQAHIAKHASFILSHSMQCHFSSYSGLYSSFFLYCLIFLVEHGCVNMLDYCSRLSSCWLIIILVVLWAYTGAITSSVTFTACTCTANSITWLSNHKPIHRLYISVTQKHKYSTAFVQSAAYLMCPNLTIREATPLY